MKKLELNQMETIEASGCKEIGGAIGGLGAVIALGGGPAGVTIGLLMMLGSTLTPVFCGGKIDYNDNSFPSSKSVLSLH